LAEVAVGPGVVACRPEAAALGAGLRRFLTDSVFAQNLTEAAAKRRVRTMCDYARDLATFVSQTTRVVAAP